MANKKIWEFPENTNTQGNLVFLVDENFTTQKLSLSGLTSSSFFSQFLTDYYVTGGTYSNGTLTLRRQNGSIAITGFSFTYEIGQYVASEGGVIAHRWRSTTPLGSPAAGTVQNYLVLDTDNVSSAVNYSSVNGTNYGSNSYTDGLFNTNNLIGKPGIVVGTAAYECYYSTNNGKSDWYLPAADEFRIIYSNMLDINSGLSAISGTTISGYDSYWTSTEFPDFTPGEAWSIANNLYNNNPQDTSYFMVRAMRRFSI